MLYFKQFWKFLKLLDVNINRTVINSFLVSNPRPEPKRPIRFKVKEVCLNLRSMSNMPPRSSNGNSWYNFISMLLAYD